MQASQNLLKQRQYIFSHYQPGDVSPGHAPVVGSVVGVCMGRVSPFLRPSFASHVRRTVGVVVVLLLLLSGDVETNPGPVGEVLCLLQCDVSLTGHTLCGENESGPTATIKLSS